jgi:RNA recognition motif-containing protein
MESLYVGNLSWQTTEEDILSLFKQHIKVVDARLITDRETGRSKGFAFVDVEDDEVEKAIEALNGFELDGRSLIVN